MFYGKFNVSFYTNSTSVYNVNSLKLVNSILYVVTLDGVFQKVDTTQPQPFLQLISGMSGSNVETDSAAGSLARLVSPNDVSILGTTAYVTQTPSLIGQGGLHLRYVNLTIPYATGSVSFPSSAGLSFRGIATYNNKLYVVDSASTSVKTLTLTNSTSMNAAFFANLPSNDNEQYAFIEVNKNTGDFYVSDYYSSTIVRISRQGTTSVAFGGNPAAGAPIDNIGTLAIFDTPSQLCFSPSGGNSGLLFVADKNNNLIRQIDVSSSNVTTIAGNITASAVGHPGVGAAATFANPLAIACNDDGSTLYVGDSRNLYKATRIRLTKGNVSAS